MDEEIETHDAEPEVEPKQIEPTEGVGQPEVLDSEPKTMGLKESLIERSRQIKKVFARYMEELKEPTTVAEIAKTIGANRVTVAKYLMQSMEKGNPYNVGIKKIGMYEIIWKKLPKYEEEIAQVRKPEEQEQDVQAQEEQEQVAEIENR